MGGMIAQIVATDHPETRTVAAIDQGHGRKTRAADHRKAPTAGADPSAWSG